MYALLAFLSGLVLGAVGTLIIIPSAATDSGDQGEREQAIRDLDRRVQEARRDIAAYLHCTHDVASSGYGESREADRKAD